MAGPDRMHPLQRRVSGFTLVELLVASVVLIVVLGIVAVFFAQQTRVARVANEHSDTQDRARLVAQLVTQDLSLAGGKRYILNDGSIDTAGSIAACPNTTVGGTTFPACLEVSTSNAADAFATLYVNSLRSVANACRSVAYRFSGNQLLRYDQAFSCSGSLALADTTSTTDFEPIADDILALDIQITCSNGNEIAQYPDQTDCPYGTSYPRSATITVIAASAHTIDGASSKAFTSVTGQSVTCPAGRYCYDVTQEVLMPNLKDD